MLSAFGISNTRASVVNWDLYLKILSILQFYTASREIYVDFWLKYFNIYNLPELPLDGMMKSIELLARGCYTQTSTLVSESFAKNFQFMLQSKNLIVGPLSESVDMVEFKKMFNSGEIDIEPLVQALQ